MRLTAPLIACFVALWGAAPAFGAVDKTWELPLMAYSDDQISVYFVNLAYPRVKNPARIRFIRKVAREQQIPGDLLLGVYGLYSGYGQFREDQFGLDAIPGPPRSRSYRYDAKRAAQELRRLYRMLYGIPTPISTTHKEKRR